MLLTTMQYLIKNLFKILSGNKFYYSSLFYRANNLRLIDISSEVIVVYLEELTEMTKTYHKHDKDLQYNLQSTCAHFFECLVIINSIILFIYIID